jgi:GT2 family glycosyltransferase
MKTAVVIPNWNGDEHLAECIDSLISQSQDTTVIVVDNGSTDHSRRIIESYGNDIVKIYQEENYGFTGGVNPGIKYALTNKFEAVALFNNDAVADKEWLQHLLSALEDTQVGIATCMLLHSDGNTIDSTGELYSKWGLPFPRDRGASAPSTSQPDNIFGATGGASLYRTALFDDIGVFDHDFFAYYEDVDISFRAQLAGWHVKYVPSAIAYHKQGATSSKLPGFTIYQTFKNLPWLLVKNVPRRLLPSIGLRFYTAYTLMFWKAVARGDGWMALKGMARSLVFMPRKISQRFSIQKTRSVPDSYIESIIWNDLPPHQSGLRTLRKILTGR